jgi:ribonuclease G
MPVGTVCIGKISEIKPDINACFLLLKDKQKCFMQLPEAEAAVNLSREGNGIKCGDNLLIEISKEPAKGKLASARAFPDKSSKKTVSGVSLSDKSSFSGDSNNFAEFLAVLQDARTRTDFSIIREGEDYIDKSLQFALSITKAYGDDGPVRVLTDQAELVNSLGAHIDRFTPDGDSTFLAPKFYEDALVSLKVLYGLESKVQEALSRKVWLKSGSYITIENTEAMTVIDVNSAKSFAKKSEEDHYFTVNAEAADEIVRQIVLRNLSGIIIVDFINMKNKDLQNDIIDRIRNHPLNYEKTMNICGFTRLGLLELTRRKTGHPLTEVFTL